MRGGCVSSFLCIEKSVENLATLQVELVENEHSKNGSSSYYRLCAMAGTKLKNYSPKISLWTIAS